MKLILSSRLWLWSIFDLILKRLEKVWCWIRVRLDDKVGSGPKANTKQAKIVPTFSTWIRSRLLKNYRNRKTQKNKNKRSTNKHFQNKKNNLVHLWWGSNTKTCFRVPLKKKRSRPIRCCLVQRLPGAVLSVFVAWASLGKTGWLGSFVTTLLPVYPFSTPTTARQSANNMSDKEILSQSKRLKKKSNLLWEAFQEVHPCIELS